MALNSFFFSLLIFLLPLSSAAANTIAKPNCETKCGNLTVPYPFGVGLNSSCSIHPLFDVNCNSTFDPPKAFLSDSTLEILDFSDNQLRVKNLVTAACFDKSGNKLSIPGTGFIYLGDWPYTFSDTNKFTVIGCDDLGIIKGFGGRNFTAGCVSTCASSKDLINGECTGIGCCQTTVPKGLNNFQTTVFSFSNHTETSEFNPCGYSFLGDPRRKLPK